MSIKTNIYGKNGSYLSLEIISERLCFRITNETAEPFPLEKNEIDKFFTYILAETFKDKIFRGIETASFLNLHKDRDGVYVDICLNGENMGRSVISHETLKENIKTFKTLYDDMKKQIPENYKEYYKNLESF